MAAKKTRATLADLMAKKARTKEVTISTPDGDLSLLFKSISSKAYDDLQAEHKPTKEQAKDGNTWNPDTFPAALMAACSVEPVMTYEEAAALWDSPEWSRGELMDMFLAVIKLNSEGLNVPFNESA